MISRVGEEIRVERQEWRRWVELVAGGGVFLGVLWFLVFAPGKRPAPYLAVLVLLAVFVATVRFYLRRRDVLIVSPDRLGHGAVDGPIRWIPRDEVGSVRIRRTPLFDVSFYDKNDRFLTSAIFSFFSVREVREAFESAGIPLR